MNHAERVYRKAFCQLFFIHFGCFSCRHCTHHCRAVIGGAVIGAPCAYYGKLSILAFYNDTKKARVSLTNSIMATMTRGSSIGIGFSVFSWRGSVWVYPCHCSHNRRYRIEYNKTPCLSYIFSKSIMASITANKGYNGKHLKCSCSIGRAWIFPRQKNGRAISARPSFAQLVRLITLRRGCTELRGAPFQFRLPSRWR